MSGSLDDFIGKLIGNRYRLTSFIAAGGMGAVYRGEDTRLGNRTIAVKILTETVWMDPTKVKYLRKRFEEEAQLSGILGENRHIIQVTDYGLEQNQPFLVMEYLKGRSLEKVLEHEQYLDSRRVLRLGIQLCAGFHHAHSFETRLDQRTITGILHRDIKPSNIFIVKEDTLEEMVKILDFGIAKANSDMNLSVGSSGFLGTASFASPEQLRGEVLDKRSDIYSLGLVLYQMLTGKHPLQPPEPSLSGWYYVHNHESPRSFESLNLKQDIPRDLANLVMDCLRKKREERPANMLILKDKLEAILIAYKPRVNPPAIPKPTSRSLETLPRTLPDRLPEPKPKQPVYKMQDQKPPDPKPPVIQQVIPNPTPAQSKPSIPPVIAGAVISLGLGGILLLSSQIITRLTPETPPVITKPDPVPSPIPPTKQSIQSIKPKPPSPRPNKKRKAAINPPPIQPPKKVKKPDLIDDLPSPRKKPDLIN